MKIIESLLIVEDEDLIRKSLKRYFEKHGIQVDAVSSGAEALDLLKNRKFDRVLCDLMLQDFTGFDILEECRSVLGIEEIRKTFIIMTAYSSEEIAERVAKFGLLLLKKPFRNLEAVLTSIMNLEPEKYYKERSFQ